MDRMRRTFPLAVIALALAAASLAGCGGGSGNSGTSSSSGRAASAPARRSPVPSPSAPSVPSTPPSAYQVPRGVPQTDDGGTADDVSKRVITKWLGALSAGNIPRAARFFAIPSKVQNGTTVITLRSAAERAFFNETFPCGAQATKLQHAKDGFTIVDFVLTERRGGSCGGGTGGTARSAIKVVRGHITEWYRLDELPSPGATPPATDAGPGTAIA
jgi:hypothetical protein